VSAEIRLELLPLEYLNPGDWAEVVDVTGDPSVVGRLGELGVRAGNQVLMVRNGAPCLIQVHGSRLSLRSGRELQVLVRPLT